MSGDDELVWADGLEQFLEDEIASGNDDAREALDELRKPGVKRLMDDVIDVLASKVLKKAIEDAGGIESVIPIEEMSDNAN